MNGMDTDDGGDGMHEGSVGSMKFEFFSLGGFPDFVHLRSSCSSAVKFSWIEA
jgi:hypothetical protein